MIDSPNTVITLIQNFLKLNTKKKQQNPTTLKKSIKNKIKKSAS